MLASQPDSRYLPLSTVLPLLQFARIIKKPYSPYHIEINIYLVIGYRYHI